MPISYLLYKEEKEKKRIRWIVESIINHEPKFPINVKYTHTRSISSLHTQLTCKKFVDTGEQDNKYRYKQILLFHCKKLY